jgi:hypothetical protein
MLVNSNMPQSDSLLGGGPAPPAESDLEDDETEDDEGLDLLQSGLTDLNGLVDTIFADLGIEDG